MSERVDILFPISRLVQGSLTDMQDTDAEGKPLTVKTGTNVGQPTERSFFAVAIAKRVGQTHWAQQPVDWNAAEEGEYWGLTMWNAAAAAWPKGQSGGPSFAFKVEDGDSTVPNTKGRKNCDRPGFPGCWVLNFGSGYPVKVVNGDGTVVIDGKVVKLGHFVQPFGSYVSNKSDLKPGMFLNHTAVSYQGFGEEIHLGVDTTKVGFGSGAKPSGMSAVPVGGASQAQMAAASGAPAIPGTAAPAIPQTGSPAIPGAATAVKPATPFVAAPLAPKPPQAAPLPPVGDPATTTGIAYASYITQGWTVEQLKAAGIIA